jgi:hypothetical protein
MGAQHDLPENRLPAWLNQAGLRLRRIANRLFLRGDPTALLLAFGMLILPALTMQAAAWTIGLEQLIPVSLLSVLLGFLLARSHYGELLCLVLSGVYGIGLVGLVTALNMPGDGSVLDRFADLAQRVGAWFGVLAGQGVSQDNLIFVLFLSVLFWFLGHNTAWHIFRVDRVWRAILPPGLVILVNAFYYTGDAPLGYYMAVFAVLALLLIVRSAIDEQEWEWYLRHISFPPQLRTQFLRWGGVLAILLVGVAWALPNGSESESLERIQEFLNSDPLSEINQLFNRLFASLDSEGLATADYYGGNMLQLGGAIRLGDQPVMLVQPDPPQAESGRYYWRSRTFSTYEGGRWTPTALLRLTVPDPGFDIENPPVLAGARLMSRQQFTMVLNASRLVYTAPQPEVLDLPVAIDLSYVGEAQELMDVSVIRPLEVLRTSDVYTATSSLVAADAPALRAAGTDYPLWVLAQYLQVGTSVTQRTRDLAVQIAAEAGAATPYDQAKAIERWLRANITYAETISGPPAGSDPVDWVLFEDRRGYCNYYASAMIMMLRSLGIPARLAAGFSQGEWDGATQGYLVRERDAHTWVEVYFPGTGGWSSIRPQPRLPWNGGCPDQSSRVGPVGHAAADQHAPADGYADSHADAARHEYPRSDSGCGPADPADPDSYALAVASAAGRADGQRAAQPGDSAAQSAGKLAGPARFAAADRGVDRAADGWRGVLRLVGGVARPGWADACAACLRLDRALRRVSGDSARFKLHAG